MMRAPRCLATFAVVAISSASIIQAQSPASADGTAVVSGSPAAVPSTGSVDITPATVFLACRAPKVLDPEDPDPIASRVRAFCARTRVPRRGTRLNDLELSAWGSVPSTADIATSADGAKAAVHRSLLNLLELPAIDWRTDQRTLDTAQLARIQEMATRIEEALRRDSTIRIQIEGRADSNLGTLKPEENRILATTRAEAIRDALIAVGVPKKALVAVGRVQWDAVTGSDPAAGRRSTYRVSLATPRGEVTVTPQVSPAITGTSSMLAVIGEGLVEEARAQLAEYMLAGAGRRICARAGVYLIRTCAWFEGSANRGYLPSVSTLRATLDADLAGVPLLWMEDYLLASLPSTPDRAKLRQRLGVLYLTHGLERYLEGETPLQIAGGLPTWVEEVTDPVRSVIPPGYRDLARSLPEFQWANALKGYVGRLEESQDLLRAYLGPEALGPDTAALYALRTVAVTEKQSGDRLMRMLQTGRTLLDATQAADSIRGLIMEGAPVDSAARAVQRARYEAMLRVVSSSLIALVPDESGENDATRWSQVAQRTAPHLVSLVSAASARDHRGAMQTVTSLVVDLGRNLPAWPATCLRNRRRDLVLQSASERPRTQKEERENEDPCDQLSVAFPQMSQRTLGLLGFVTDVASARTEAEVKDAVRAYVRQQGGSHGKRFGTGRLYWSVNSYVGLQHLQESLDDADQPIEDRGVTGAYLPIGFEGGVRLSESGKLRGLTASVFLQAVDLGAVALYRPHQEKDGVQSEVDWHRIVAPGIGVMLGLGEVPFSIGFIGSFAPAAREIADFGDVDALRWGLVVGFDLPLLR